jgi:anti-anti-sigma factor
VNSSEQVISSREHDDHDVLEVRGELDLSNTRELEDALAGTQRRTVILDLSLLGFVDSAGIRSIDVAHRHLRGSGRALVVVAPAGSRADWTFRVAGMDSELVFDSLESATLRATANRSGNGSA